MKKMFTLGFGILLSVISFAAIAPSRLVVAAEGNPSIKVTVDGNRFEQQMVNNSVVFENLQPGFHSVKIYQLTDKRYGMFGRRGGATYQLVYNSSVNIKPLFTTRIELNLFGNAQVIEQPMRGNYGWDRPERNNGREYNDNNGYRGNDRDYRTNDRDYRTNDRDGRNNSYIRTISDEDFFAAERVMQRENFDDARLLYAKRLMDDNYLSAEQVKELTRFFSFDSNKLEFAKYAFTNTTDKSNFSVVCNAFSSASGRDQLLIFLKTCRY